MKLLQHLLFICLFFLGTTSAQAAPAVLNRIVASANGNAITESELTARTQLLLVQFKQSETTLPPLATIQKQLLERIILEKLQIGLATPEEQEVNEAQLDQQISQIAQQDNLSVPQLQSFLEEQGVPFSEFKKAVRNEFILRKVQQREISQQITVSEMDIQGFLNSPAGQDQTGTEYHLGHILIPIPEYAEPNDIAEIKRTAENTIKHLKSGADFAKIAMEKSSGQQALDGGDLGWYKMASLPTLFDTVVPTLQPNEIHGPIQNASGFHIIKLLGKREPNTAATLQQSHVRQILLQKNKKRSSEDAQTLVSKVHEKIKEGANFSALAKQYSEESSSSEKGGDIGWVTKESPILPELFEQIAKLKPGETSQPFETPLGWNIVQVAEKRAQKVPSKELHDRAMETLFGRKFEESLISWLKYLRADSEVEIYLDEKN